MNIADFILTGMKKAVFDTLSFVYPFGRLLVCGIRLQASFFPFADDALSGGKEGIMYFDAKEFGRRVVALRKEKGLLQNELADELNISRVYMSAIERALKTPSLDLMIEMAEYFHVSLDYLILGRACSPDGARCQSALQQAIGILNNLESLYQNADVNY